MAKPRRRQLNIFTLSFLDVMAGGFGAVAMLFLIINHSTDDAIDTANREELAEARLIEYQLKVGEEDLAKLREIVAQLSLRLAVSQERVEELREEAEETELSLEQIELIALHQSEALEQLRSEVETKEEEVKRLEAMAAAQQDTATIEIEGEGNRQYLTGLYMGGSHILIALDTSASMLDSTIVNIVRRRNMSLDRQLEAPKWVRAVDTVQWLVANIPLDSRFQIATFGETAQLEVGDGSWHEASDSDAITSSIETLRLEPPSGGTNLESLFLLTADMRPMPDNLFLITDGLPTMDSRNNRRTVITGRQRVRVFDYSLGAYPGGFPVNVILLPLEGDPWAAGRYWNLAYSTAGTFMTPSEDWP